MNRPTLFCTLALFAPAVSQAELIAHIATNNGTLDVVLHYDEAPMTVANFMTLAQGTRAFVDPVTNKVVKRPFYNGQSIYSTVSEGLFQFASEYAVTGSPTGSVNWDRSVTNGSTGFTIPDEADDTLKHTGYKLSMANIADYDGNDFLNPGAGEINRGPNSGSCEIMLFGKGSFARFDGINTVFGSIEPASQSTMDFIIIFGAGSTIINNITFSRTYSNAQNFDEHAQNLPTVGVPEGTFRPTESGTYFDYDEALGSGSFLTTSYSADLSSWGPETTRLIDPDAAPEASTLVDNVGADTGFYTLFLNRNPGSLTPASLARAF